MKVYKFSAPWCGPCRQLNPIIKSLKDDGYKIIDVNIDEEEEFSDKYNIKSVPTIMLTDDDGIEQRRLLGVKTKEEIINFIKGD